MKQWKSEKTWGSFELTLTWPWEAIFFAFGFHDSGDDWTLLFALGVICLQFTRYE